MGQQKEALMSNGKITIENPGSATGVDTRSSVDKVLGKHTNSFIVAGLFFVTLVGFVIYMIVFKEKLSDMITTGFISILSGLGGFFAASLKADS
jgi:hypothetical protein